MARDLLLLQGMLRYNADRCGVITVWCYYGMVCCGMIRYRIVKSMAWNGIEWCGMVWYGKA